MRRSISDFTDDEIADEYEYREGTVIKRGLSFFSDDDLIDEIESRRLSYYGHDLEELTWLYNAKKYEDFLIFLERCFSGMFSDISRKRLVDE